MRIINLITDLSRVNFGVWNAALNTANTLQEKYGAPSELWSPMRAPEESERYGVRVRQIKGIKDLPLDTNPEQDVIVSHGAWTWATKMGYALKKRGLTWIYTPHGMLEPWSMNQKKFKKAVYFNLVEKRYIAHSDAIRAVGSPEKKNLEKLFPNQNIILIPNGIEIETSDNKGKAGSQEFQINKSTNQQINMLFLSRLHHKKGVVPLAKAWVRSSLFNNPRYSLIIAGPDDGEKGALLEVINALPGGSNISYAGAVYGAEKDRLLARTAFFCLPSFSEGFPTSIVEAMFYGCIPVITEGCNFPEAFEYKLAIKTSPAEEDIKMSLEEIAGISEEQIREMAKKNHEFILERYTVERIAEKQVELYETLLHANGVAGKR